MARATGSRAKLYLGYETVAYGTAATGNFETMRFISSDFGAAQGIEQDDVLGTDRQPSAPYRDGIDVGGPLVVPVDLRLFGHWLKLLLGAPVTSGTTDYTHVFTGGAASLPSASIEIAHPGVPKYALNTGCMMNSMQLHWAARGNARATCQFVSQAEAVGDASGAGTPTSQTYTRFHQFKGFIKKDDAALATITAIDVTIANNFDPVRVIRDGGLIDGVDLGSLAVNLTITSRFADTTFLDAAVADTAVDLEFGWQISATKSLLIETPAVHLERSKIPVEGPQGISVTTRGIVAKPDAADALTVTLKNDVASY